MSSHLLAVVLLGLAPVGFGAVQAVDFSTEAARAKLPSFEAVSSRGRVVDELTSHGRWGYRFTITKGFAGGVPQWPSVDLPSAVRDWTPYDRIVIDAFNAAPGGDCFGAFFAAPTGRVTLGCGTHGLKFLETDGFSRWEIPFRWPKTMDRTNVARVHLFYESPICADVTFGGFWLLKPGEEAPPPDAAFMEKKVRAAERKRTAERQLQAVASRQAFVARCRAAGQASAPWIGRASSMDQICPRDAFNAAAADRFSLRLARGETEALQVLVYSDAADLAQVGVCVSDLACGTNRLASSSFRICPVGYVETKDPAPYPVGYNIATNLPGGYLRTKRNALRGWYPDPILDYLSVVDIRRGDVQSFWVSLTCPRDQPSGTYAGTLSVAGRTFPFSVRVYGFAVPRTSPLPITASFRPIPNVRVQSKADRDQIAAQAADPRSPLRLWSKQNDAWTDFLADHYVSRDWLYHHSDVPWEQLLRLKKQGRLGIFNLGGWDPPKDASDASRAAFVEKIRKEIAPAYEKAKALGLLDHAYIYGCDECPESTFDGIKMGLEELKRVFPGVPLHTTAYDKGFGVGTRLAGFDVFTPTTDVFAQADPAAITASRKAGHQVWWYIACNQRAPLANLFVECPPVEARQLMGAQTVKWRPDGFLYYQLSIWQAMHVIDGPSSFTDWDPRAWGRFHGDGGWLCCGPDGKPISTLRFENFRDGLEDLAYAQEYERATGRKCVVPASVCRAIDQYTDDAAAYYAWRDGLAEAIESAKPNLVAAGGWKNVLGPLTVVRADGSVVFENADTNRSASMKQDVKLRAGCTYAFGAEVSTVKLDGNVCVCLEWYGKKGYLGGAYTANPKGTNVRMPLEAVSRPIPTDATHAILQVVCSRGAVGKAVFDGIWLREREMPLVDGLYSSRYRNGAADGCVTFKAALTLPEGSCRTAKGMFRISGAASASVRSLPVEVTDREAAVTCRVSDLAMGENRVEFTLSDVSGRTNETAAIAFTRQTPEQERAIKVRFDQYGRTIVDGKPFFPLGMYLYGRFDAKLFDDYCDGPFNCFVDYDGQTRERLDLCAKKGMKVICNVVGKDLSDGTEIRRFCDHPAVLAWYLNDERPISQRAAMTAERGFLEKYDPNHPGWIVIWQHGEVRDYLPTFDVIGTDPYPLYRKPIGMVTEWVNDTRLGTMGLKPLWQVVQVQDAEAYRWKNPSLPKEVCGAPTYDEIRNMAWQSLVGGAKGLVFYSFFDLVRMDGKTPWRSRWADLKRVVGEIKGYESYFLTTEPSQVVTVDDARVVAAVWRRGDKELRAAVNTSRETVRAKLSVNGQVETLEMAPMAVRLVNR